MRYAIMADVHGQERELVKALQLTEPDDRIVFLGDVPNYRSKEGMLACLISLQQHKVRGIRGNCDDYVLKFYERPPEVDREIWDFYRSWPKKYAEGEVLFVHGSPRSPLAERIDSIEKARENFQAGDFTVCFHGHRHRLTCFEYMDQDVRLLPLMADKPLLLHPAGRYIIGVGSIGDPRDEQLGSVVFYDPQRREVVVRHFALG